MVCRSAWHPWQPQGTAGWCQRGSGQEPGLQAVLARLEDGGFITMRLGGCRGCVEERLRKVSHSDVTPSPATFWPLAVLWLLSTQPGRPTSRCCLTSPRSSHFVSMVFLVFFFDSSSDVQEKIIQANRPGRQAFPLAGPRVYSRGEQLASDPE